MKKKNEKIEEEVKEENKSKKEKKKKKHSKAFTLIELLAVIIILGVLMIIAIPSVTTYISNSRKSSYVDTVQELVGAARTLVNSGKLETYDRDTTYYIPTSCLPTENGARTPYGEFSTAYVLVTYSGNGYDYYFTGNDTSKTGIKTVVPVDKLSTDNIEPNVEDTDINLEVGIDGRENVIVYNGNCSSYQKVGADGQYYPDTNTLVTPVVNKCSSDIELVQGAEVVSGQFTYRYMQEGTYNSWKNVDSDGWGVKLTDPNSTAPVNTQLCTSINDKPIVSMSYMFYATQAESIDFSSFNTSKVTNMSSMFAGRIKTKHLDLRSFDTRNVTDMSNMFAYAQATLTLDVSSFRTSNVTNMYNMFAALSEVKELDVSHFDTSNVTNMGGMFYTTRVTHLDVSNFDTSKVTNMRDMFNTYMGESITFGPKFDTSNVTNMEEMFFRCHNITELDLSTFNTSNVTSMYGMFGETIIPVYDLSTFDMSNVTNRSMMFYAPSYRPRTETAIGYARTAEDAAKLNSGTGAGGDKLRFVVKNQ